MGLFHNYKPVFYTDPKRIFYNCSNKDKKKARERYDFFVELFEENNDKQGKDNLEEVKKNCARYVEKVVNSIVEAQAFKAGKISKKDMTEIDDQRKHAHDVLISNVLLFNRTVAKKYGWEAKGGKIPEGGIFTLDPEYIHVRAAFTDWAYLLVSSLYKRECAKAKNADYDAA